jgi:uncharacterized membrane protein YfcA
MIFEILIGIVAGVLAGLFGVGGGILFVPALVAFADLGQLDAEATSLLAIIPVALVGVLSQRRYGNVRLVDGVVIGVLSTGGAFLGVAIANAVPERALEIGFACVMLLAAFELARRALREEPE